MPAALTAVVLLLACRGAGGQVLRAQADLDGDGSSEQVILDRRSTLALRVIHRNRVVASAVPRRWNPWKLAVADVDGDGRFEIAVGLYKSTRFLPHPHNCLFLYTFRRGELQPYWLGSSLSRPFCDFLFAPPCSGRMWTLYAVETDQHGARSLAEYRWNGFGFTLERRTGRWQTLRLLSADCDTLHGKADGRAVTWKRHAVRRAAPQTRRNP